MKKKHIGIVFLLFFLFLSGLYGQTREDFAAVVDFNLDLETLSQLASGQADFFSGNAPLVLVTGSVASRMVVRPGPEDYLAEIEIVDGRWQGLEAVTTFRCIVRFEGPDYVTFVPARRSRRPPPEEIPLNATVLVVGKPVEVRSGESGEEAVLAGYFVRILD